MGIVRWPVAGYPCAVESVVMPVSRSPAVSGAFIWHTPHHPHCSDPARLESHGTRTSKLTSRLARSSSGRRRHGRNRCHNQQPAAHPGWRRHCYTGRPSLLTSSSEMDSSRCRSSRQQRDHRAGARQCHLGNLRRGVLVRPSFLRHHPTALTRPPYRLINLRVYKRVFNERVLLCIHPGSLYCYVTSIL